MNYIHQFHESLNVSPLASLIGGTTAPFIIGVGFGVLYLIQAFSSRKYQALAPVK